VETILNLIFNMRNDIAYYVNYFIIKMYFLIQYILMMIFYTFSLGLNSTDEFVFRLIMNIITPKIAKLKKNYF
jgi:hypothetical protein